MSKIIERIRARQAAQKADTWISRPWENGGVKAMAEAEEARSLERAEMMAQALKINDAVCARMAKRAEVEAEKILAKGYKEWRKAKREEEAGRRIGKTNFYKNRSSCWTAPPPIWIEAMRDSNEDASAANVDFSTEFSERKTASKYFFKR